MLEILNTITTEKVNIKSQTKYVNENIKNQFNISSWKVLKFRTK